MRNDFRHSAKYYDIIQGTRFFRKSAVFVGNILKKFKVRTVLELGCGTGLYLAPLSKHFDIEGLDISKKMLSLARKTCKVKLHQKNMSNFRLKKQFDAVLCLNSSLLYLHDYRSIEKTIKNIVLHLKPKGIFLLDLPHLDVEIREQNYSQEYQRYTLPNGHLDVIFRDYKKGNKWAAEWIGFAKEGKKFFSFKDYYEELIYSPAKLEKILKKYGFTILNIYGSRLGGSFNKNASYRRFYVLQKQ